MPTSILKIASSGTVIASKVTVAKDFGTRFVGLMFRRSLPEGEALIITHCNMVHMFFMRFAIDTIFINAGFEVLDSQSNLKPWRISKMVHGAAHVVELPAGTLEITPVKQGDQLELTNG